jgi:A/G-specific adenine glycosylase
MAGGGIRWFGRIDGSRGSEAARGRVLACGKMRAPDMSSQTQLDVELREQRFRAQLLAWYDAHARGLPWRESHDPYRVWLSEIMLQQTRVAAVITHYHEFLRRFPTVEKLARAREASVLAAWSGLGYYRRAGMLHAAAKVVVRKRGKFPDTAEGLRELPGVGRYTAAAIASIAFGEAVAVVDGNVERVLRRFSGQRLAGEEFWLAAERLLDRARPGDFNQAMMELGATVCTPRAPACLTCPVVEWCATRGEMAGAPKLARQTKREIHYALACREGKVFLVQRARDARLMAGMWELPEVHGGTAGAKARSNVAGRIAALKRCATQKQRAVTMPMPPSRSDIPSRLRITRCGCGACRRWGKTAENGSPWSACRGLRLRDWREKFCGKRKSVLPIRKAGCVI